MGILTVTLVACSSSQGHVSPESFTHAGREAGTGADMTKDWGIIALVVAGLYWLQAVLIPLALAVLLTFLLSPVVSTLQRRGLGRVPSVVVTVLLALSILGGIGWSLTGQLVTLADELPRYSLNIHHRIADLRGVGKGGSVEKVQKTVEDVVGEIQKTDPQGVTREKPIAVILEPPSILAHLPTLLQALASAGVVTVLMIFMLLERRDLRDRVILLIGYRRMTATTSRPIRKRRWPGRPPRCQTELSFLAPPAYAALLH